MWIKILLVTVLLVFNVVVEANKLAELPNPPAPDTSQCQLVQYNDRLDCFPQNNANQQDCEARGCCWLPPQKLGANLPDIPYCFYQPKAISYVFTNITNTPNGVTAVLERTYKSPYPRDIPVLKFEATFQNDTILRIKITDPSNQRFESPFPILNLPESGSKNPLYRLNIEGDRQGFKIIRNSDNTTIFDASDFTNFIYSDQFLQITTKLPSKYIYGLGEQRNRLLLPTYWKQITLFNHDTSPQDNVNVYGTHPFYLLMENSTNAHGVFLKNSNGMELVLQSTPALTYRTIGGILDFFVFLGPTPSDVIKQYQEVISKPSMPPYWSLGFHLCRYGYNDLATTKKILQQNLDAGVFVETQWNDLDYMDQNNDFTYNKDKYNGLPEFVAELHRQGRRYALLIDPGVSGSEKPGSYPPYDRGVELDVFVKNSSGEILLGRVWNYGSTVFPDFTHPNISIYWKEMLKTFHDVVPFDGTWIDMNEPSNNVISYGCPDSELETPFYSLNVDGGQLKSKSICMTAKHYQGVHYNWHNLYGISEAYFTSRAMSEILGERPLIISRSSFAGLGRYGGHWSGDINSSWDDLRYSIPELLTLSLFGVPLMGSDICGFSGDSNEDLCNRWMQLGAFYPFSRNHNTLGARAQDPVSMGEQVVRSSVKALTIRYTLLPYLYTLFWQAHTEGLTVARPLFLEFPEDSKTYDIDTSFLWGSALLIAPILENDPKFISVYLPRGIWYDYYSRNSIKSSGQYFTIDANKDTIPLFIRGGQVITTQAAANTTEEVRNSGLRLIAALDDSGVASGLFYWDDGLTENVGDNYTVLNFTAENGALSISVEHSMGIPPPKIYSIEILGLQYQENHPSFSTSRNYTYTFVESKKNLLIKNLNIESYPASIEWF